MARPRRSTQYSVHTPDWTFLAARNERNALRLARREAMKSGKPVKVERFTRRKGEWRARQITVEVPNE